MSARWAWVAVAGSIFLVGPTHTAGQSFEGSVRQRTLEVDEELLMELMYEGDVEEPDFNSEEEWIAWTANRLFEIPFDRLVSRGAEATDLTTWIKGDRLRSDVSEMGGDAYMIYDGSTGTVLMVQPAERWYVRFSEQETQAMAEDAMRQAEEMAAAMGIDLEELQRMSEEMEHEAPHYEEDMGGNVTVRELAERRSIAGVSTNAREALSSEGAARAWCAVENPPFAEALEQLAEQLGIEDDEEEEMDYMTGPPREALEDVACGDQMPLLVQSFDAFGGMMGGGSYTIEEIMSIEASTVDDEMFEIPAGFEERTLEDLWRLSR